ncbi:MAG: PIN domain-containing protein [Deltaproteobacteria bacterium]|nr:PIN domain-containing protein [Deltaproteobacteria bacterium]
MRALLDVNVLIALLDAGHVRHSDARAWLIDHAAAGWASCALTQNGCVRIMASPGYPGAHPVAAVAARLRKATEHPAHAFWPCDLSLLDVDRVNEAHLLGPRQLTDVYLLALAVRHGGRVVTMDARITPAAVQGARAEHLCVI